MATTKYTPKWKGTYTSGGTTYSRYFRGYVTYTLTTTNTTVTMTVSAMGIQKISEGATEFGSGKSTVEFEAFHRTELWGYTKTCTKSHSTSKVTFSSSENSSKNYLSSSLTWSFPRQSSAYYVDCNIFAEKEGSSWAGLEDLSFSFSVPAKPRSTVTLNANGGNFSMISTSVTDYYGNTLVLPTKANATRTGYTFLGMNTSASATTASYAPGAKYTFDTTNRTLYAIWQINRFTYTFNANGGTVDGVTSKSVTNNYGTAGITLSDASYRPTRAGYVFEGWECSNGTTYWIGSTIPSFTANLTFTAKWEQEYYPVTFGDTSVQRTDSAYHPLDTGTYASADVSYTLGKVTHCTGTSASHAITHTIPGVDSVNVRITTDEPSTGARVVNTTIDTTNKVIHITAENMSQDYSYVLSVTLTDTSGQAAGTIGTTLKVNKAEFVMDINKDGSQIGFFEAASDSTLDPNQASVYNGKMITINADVLIKGFLKNMYPVGSIYMSVNNVNPSTYFGGTWAAWGSGKVPVGVNTSETEFATVEKTGGSKYVQSHTHAFTNPSVSGGAVTNGISGGAHTHSAGSGKVFVRTNSGATIARYTYGGSTRANNINSSEPFSTLAATSSESHTHNLPAHSHTASGGSVGAVSGATTGSSGNLQPYITCYMWKRTA